MSTNADSLGNKLKELEVLCCEARPDIIVVTEVKPKNSTHRTTEAQLQLDGYDLYTNLAQGSRGICIYAGGNLKTSEVKTGSANRDSIWLDIECEGNHTLRVGGIYRSPSNRPNENKELERHLGLMLAHTPTNMDLVIAGDFNLPGVDWNSLHSYRAATHPSTTFLNFFMDNNLTQHVNKPTRHREGQRDSIPDLILTREEETIDEVNYLAHLGKSDHCVITADINTRPQLRNRTKRLKCFDRGDYVMLKR